MTSSKIRGFQTPSVIFRHLRQTPPLDDVIFPQPPPLFPKMIFGKLIFMVKLRNQDLAMNIKQNKDQSHCC